MEPHVCFNLIALRQDLAWVLNNIPDPDSTQDVIDAVVGRWKEDERNLFSVYCLDQQLVPGSDAVTALASRLRGRDAAVCHGLKIAATQFGCLVLHATIEHLDAVSRSVDDTDFPDENTGLSYLLSCRLTAADNAAAAELIPLRIGQSDVLPGPNAEFSPEDKDFTSRRALVLVRPSALVNLLPRGLSAASDTLLSGFFDLLKWLCDRNPDDLELTRDVGHLLQSLELNIPPRRGIEKVALWACRNGQVELWNDSVVPLFRRYSGCFSSPGFPSQLMTQIAHRVNYLSGSKDQDKSLWDDWLDNWGSQYDKIKDLCEWLICIRDQLDAPVRPRFNTYMLEWVFAFGKALNTIELEAADVTHLAEMATYSPDDDQLWISDGIGLLTQFIPRVKMAALAALALSTGSLVDRSDQRLRDTSLSLSLLICELGLDEIVVSPRDFPQQWNEGGSFPAAPAPDFLAIAPEDRPHYANVCIVIRAAMELACHNPKKYSSKVVKILGSCIRNFKKDQNAYQADGTAVLHFLQELAKPETRLACCSNVKIAFNELLHVGFKLILRQRLVPGPEAGDPAVIWGPRSSDRPVAIVETLRVFDNPHFREFISTEELGRIVLSTGLLEGGEYWGSYHAHHPGVAADAQPTRRKGPKKPAWKRRREQRLKKMRNRERRVSDDIQVEREDDDIRIKLE